MKAWKFVIAWMLIVIISCSKDNGNDVPIDPPPPPPVTVDDSTFTNPLLSSGPDPWVTQKDTNYYYTHTVGNKLVLFKTSKMSELDEARETTVWTPTPNTNYSDDIWAPEIHYLQNKWYMYFAADSSGVDATHRVYVIENSSADPLTPSWTMKGKVADPTNKWAIDATVFEYKSAMYMAWSGWEDGPGIQNLYIAKMLNPWTIDGNRVKISSPDYSWEKVGAPVNEAPQFLVNASGDVFLTYSASGCWTDDYKLGMLSLKENGDPLNPADWTKKSEPVFTKNAASSAFGPGHNAFFVSRDKTENWLLYHANTLSHPNNDGCGGSRSPRMQQFTFNADGTPNFGEPVRINSKILKPSGEY